MTELSIGRPESGEYAPFYADYVERASATNIGVAFTAQVDDITRAFGAFPASREGFRYAPGKWTVRELASHLVDGERVFSYRALRFARGDDTGLPGFEENDYVANGGAEDRRLRDIVEELVLLRRANAILFQSLPAAAWRRGGKANDTYMSVRAFPFVMVGHVHHHLEILRERYATS